MGGQVYLYRNAVLDPGMVSQSSTYVEEGIARYARYAVDGEVTTISHTLCNYDGDETQIWFRVQLNNNETIHKVHIINGSYCKLPLPIVSF